MFVDDDDALRRRVYERRPIKVIIGLHTRRAAVVVYKLHAVTWIYQNSLEITDARPSTAYGSTPERYNRLVPVGLSSSQRHLGD